MPTTLKAIDLGFELFDPKAEFDVRSGNMPHWYQPGVTYFVTFRTADSVPAELSRGWRLRRDSWLRERGISPESADWNHRLKADRDLEKEFQAKFIPEFMEWLDRGLGECVLRKPEFNGIVAESLRSGDGDRYRLGDFVVMPNHVHLLVGLIGNTEIERQCFSWKTYTAKRINRCLGRKGRFWQEESFDHLVRSPEQFDYLQNYIAENPLKAKLPEGDYIHYRCPTK
ncbi:MAG: transposase [Planctomycetia bacterium]|nr:transposase [Planctomycetia bacterium]